MECRESVSRKRYSDLLKEAVSYIEHHYEEEDISLNQVAASVNISPSHFSTIFSKEMGETFIEYLTNVRMERAKQLLRSSTMKTAEIAYAVGYKDAHYFSYLFKKYKSVPRVNSVHKYKTGGSFEKEFVAETTSEYVDGYLSAAAGCDHYLPDHYDLQFADRYDAIVGKIEMANAYNINFKDDMDYIMYIIAVNSERAKELVDTQKPHE